MGDPDVIRCWKCSFKAIKEQFRKTQGVCPKCKDNIVVPEFSTQGIDPKEIKKGDSYEKARDRVLNREVV